MAYVATHCTDGRYTYRILDVDGERLLVEDGSGRRYVLVIRDTLPISPTGFPGSWQNATLPRLATNKE